MDPLSFSAVVAGPMSLTEDLKEFLNAYIRGVGKGPKNVVDLVNQLDILSRALRQMVAFLRSNEVIENIAGFEPTSALRSVVTTYQQHVTNLYKRLLRFRPPPNITSQASITQYYKQLEWPLSNGECRELVQQLHRYAQTFEFSSTIPNCSLLCDTSTQVASALRKNERRTRKTIDAMNAMVGSAPDQLFELSEKLSNVSACVMNTNEHSMETYKSAPDTGGVQLKLEEDESETQFRMLLDWLSPLEPQKRHQDILSRRSPDTGEWFLQRPEFAKWIEDKDQRILACYGIPGSGKSVMTSIVIDRVKELIAEDPSQSGIVLCLHCDYRDKARQSAAHMVGALLKQIFTQRKCFGREIEEVTDKLAQKMRSGGNFELVDVELSKVCSSFHRVFICIDALDECKPEHRPALLESLEKVFHSSGARLFVTGRKMKNIKRYLTPLGPNLGVSKIQIEANQEDIRHFLAHEIDKDPYEIPMPGIFKEELTERIADSSQGMFLLPALQIQMILEQPGVARRMSALRGLPTGLNEAYDTVIERIRSQHDTAELAMRTLMFVSFAQRPLKLDELRHALAVDLGSRTLNSGELPSVKYILACCMGLTTVDTEASTIRLVHFTLQEYLDSFEERGFFNTGHSKLAETCITYLGLSEVSSMIPEEPEVSSFVRDWAWKGVRPKEIPPFWEYAGSYWGDHLRVNSYLSVESLALETLETNFRPFAIILFKKPTAEIDFSYNASLPGPLHICSYFGLNRLLTFLLEKAEHIRSINKRDYLGACPLMWAAQAGQRAAVRLLLQNGVNADTRDNYRRTPLSWAAGNGHVSVVRYLVEQANVIADSKDEGRRTPLSWAAGNGHRPAAQFLVKRDDVDANGRDSFGRTPLSWAAINGREVLVRFLVEQADIVADSEDNGGQTALSWAAHYGRDSIVRLLVERDDVDAGSKDSRGRTPLSWAAYHGRDSVVRFLVERDDVDTDHKDNSGQTPLSLAARRGHKSIVSFLVRRGDVDPSSEDNEGRTPLSWAAQNDHKSTVRLLIA